MPTITGPILDSAGRPASGILRVRASRPFELGVGLITQALGVAEVRGGEPLVANQPWTVPITPDGVYLHVEQDLDGEQLVRYTVFVPSVDVMTYAQFLFNRGQGAGGPEPFWWDLTGDADFPETAVDGDLGYDSETGNVWRYKA